MSPAPEGDAARGGNRKLALGIGWNVASLAVLGAAGIVINAVIARYHGAGALGVFNQVYALYIFASQLSVLGIHFSVLKSVSYHQEEPETCSEVTVSGLALAAGLSLAAVSTALLARHAIGRLLDSPSVALGITVAMPGLIFFALNKVLLNALNGSDRMRAFAVFQALRYVLILAGVVALTSLSLPSAYLAGSLAMAEVLLFPILLGFVHLAAFPVRLSSIRRRWLREHLSFGGRGFLSGLLTEVNTRVDVLVLGLFHRDAVVGVYSFAAILAEGFSQLPLVVRRSIDPLLGSSFSRNDRRRIELKAGQVKRAVYPAMLAIGGVATLLYPWLLEVLVADPEFSASAGVFAILMAGVVLGSGYRSFLGVLLQGGRPGAHTLLVTALVAINLVGNLLLIPVLGMHGAAIATAAAYAAEAVLLATFARRLLGIRL